MTPLEGKEVDQKFDNGAGNIIVDVDDKGNVVLGVDYSKDLNGFAKVKAGISAETNILNIAEKIAAKTATPFDDNAVKLLKSLLGIQG